jgi:peptide deformylase
MSILPISQSIGLLTLNVSPKITKTDGGYMTENGMLGWNETEFQQHIDDMLETLKDKRAVGIASIQVGEVCAIIVVKTKTGHMVLINPEIKSESETLITNHDGCLSFEGRTLLNQRPKTTTVKYMDRDWKPRVKIFRDFESVIFQHEYDHLMGLTMMSQHAFQSYDDYKEFRRVCASGYTGAIEFELEWQDSYKEDMNNYIAHNIITTGSNETVQQVNISLLRVDIANYPWLKFKNWKPVKPV